MFLQKDVRTDPVGEKETGSEEMGQALCLLDNCLLSAGLRAGNESTPYPCGWSLMRSPEKSLDCGRVLSSDGHRLEWI